ncbi:RNA polymerase sigma-70 factor [Sphingobacterium corticibacterium]|uniref:RNA polymerase sigma-70 factor n=1 Tax=Sphingobacterium corticibacterium TaxID=2484746 RepID=A0A4Q6XT67_9SPHI|nr:RNA polymerase sigma-70 factor [Sphingobacterium corticibacterium]RZF59506.1 RNA polymerase sigma-70 factor [Sphingobacterium corticibacterium]
MLLDKEKKFEEVFRTHFRELHRYAFKILGDADTAEETVQQVFLRLWEKDWQRGIHTSVRSYLYRAVYNESVNLIKREQIKMRYEIDQQHRGDYTCAQQSDAELRKQLHMALSQLPEKSRMVFEMSRFQELKYQEIAEMLTLSLKTVEGHMTKALKHLRHHLADYLNVLTLIIMIGL